MVVRCCTCWSAAGAGSPCSSRGWSPAGPWPETWGPRWTGESAGDCSRSPQTATAPGLYTQQPTNALTHKSQWTEGESFVEICRGKDNVAARVLARLPAKRPWVWLPNVHGLCSSYDAYTMHCRHRCARCLTPICILKKYVTLDKSIFF